MRRRTAALTAILEAIYGRPLRLSELVQEIGFSAAQVERCRRELAPALVRLALALLEERLRAMADAERMLAVFRARFGIEGEPESIASVAPRLELSEERAQQVESRVLRSFQVRVGRLHFESGLRAAVTAMLDEAPAEPVRLPLGGIDDEEASAAAPELTDDDLALVEHTVRSFLVAVPEGFGPGILLHLARGSTGPVVMGHVEKYRLTEWGAAAHLSMQAVRAAIVQLIDGGRLVRRGEKLVLPDSANQSTV